MEIIALRLCILRKRYIFANINFKVNRDGKV